MASDTQLLMAQMEAEHYRKQSDFHRQQTTVAADMLKAIVEELRLSPEPDPVPTPALYGMFSQEAILTAIRALRSTSATPSTASKENGSSAPRRRRSPDAP